LIGNYHIREILRVCVCLCIYVCVEKEGGSVDTKCQNWNNHLFNNYLSSAKLANSTIQSYYIFFMIILYKINLDVHRNIF